MIYDLAVVGAGPAGLSAAIFASSKNCLTLLLEKNQSAGKKLLLTGSGQCNLTHTGTLRDFISHYGLNGRFLREALRQFGNQELLDFFQQRGIAFVTDKRGKIFPATRCAADIRRVLLQECARRGVVCQYGKTVQTVDYTNGCFQVSGLGFGRRARQLILACGGCSYPTSGSNGDGYRWAEGFGHRIKPLGPALSPFFIRDFRLKSLAGLSFPDCGLSLWRGNKCLAVQRNEFLITHRGLSGPAVLHLARYAENNDLLKVDFLPECAAHRLESDLLDQAASRGLRQVSTVLKGYGLPASLVSCFLHINGLTSDIKLAVLPKAARQALVRAVKEFPLVIERCGGFDIAMATRGGVSLDEIDPQTMQSKLRPGLFFAGEIMDLDGDSGGYNLQAALATGRLAGYSVNSSISKGD